MSTVTRLYLIKPSALTTTITATELNTFGDYPSCPLDYTTVKYLYVNCEELDHVEDKKVKITRFAGRGSVVIDLREIFSTLTAKNIYLGNLFNNHTETSKRIQAWKYAHNEWNKVSPYKTGAVFVQCSVLSNNTIDTSATLTTYTAPLIVYKSGSTSNLTMIWNKQLPINIDAFGNAMLKQIELEEQL